MRHPFVPQILSRVAPRLGARVELEPEFGFAGRVLFSNGRTHVFRSNNLNINRAGAVAVSADKGYTSYFLRRFGLKTPRELTFFAPSLRRNLPKSSRRTLEDAHAFASEVGYPVIVKPNNGSLGDLVAVAANADELESVAKRIFKKYMVALVQEFLKGNDYRVVVLGDEVISAYQRIPLFVVGDGISDIDTLLRIKRDEFPALGRPNSEISPDDFRIDNYLKRHRLTRNSVVPLGLRQRLLDNANLSTGGDARDITTSLSSEVAAIAIKATSCLGLTLCGVDIMCPDATVGAKDYTIIELNGAPGLDNYAALGETQQKRVDELYEKVLRFLENHA